MDHDSGALLATPGSGPLPQTPLIKWHHSESIRKHPRTGNSIHVHIDRNSTKSNESPARERNRINSRSIPRQKVWPPSTKRAV